MILVYIDTAAILKFYSNFILNVTRSNFDSIHKLSTLRNPAVTFRKNPISYLLLGVDGSFVMYKLGLIRWVELLKKQKQMRHSPH